MNHLHTTRNVLRAALVAAFAVVVLGPTSAADASRYRQCGSANVTFSRPHGEGSAYKIRATNVTCQRARIVARACISGRPSGWRGWAPATLTDPRYNATIKHDRIELRRGRAIVTFELVGGGTDCAA